MLIVSCLASRASASELRRTPLVKAVQRVEASIVNIHTEKLQAKDAVFGTTKKVNGMGTGVIVDERGYIVTNEHVIHNVNQKAIRVELLDGRQFKAQVISFSSRDDLAIVKIDATQPVAVAPFGTSCDLMRGETVFAVGNAFGYTDSISKGIISALGRDVEVNDKISYKNLIQTDASINPGNSGGPLVNLDGEVIGINVAIRAGAQRIGFAIPIDDARTTISRLLNNEKFGTFHGLRTQDIKKPGDQRLVVQSAQSNSPAALAGLKAGDEVLKVGPVSTHDRADLERALLGIRPGTEVPMVVRRSGAELNVPLKVARFGDRKLSLMVARKGNKPLVVRGNNGETPQQHVWRTLGLRLENLSKSQLPPNFRKHYQGGLRVIEVRNDGPAAANGVKIGDVMIGLGMAESAKAVAASQVNAASQKSGERLWEMNKIEHVEFVLRKQEQQKGSLKCLLLRGKGHLEKLLNISKKN